MCGLIAAVWRGGPRHEQVVLGRDAMASRGPDAEGLWAAAEVTLGHRRLSVLDIDARSDQPLASESGRYQIVFNGEIYNFRELQDELRAAGVVLRTDSDTEVVVALFGIHGPAMLDRLRGMYAIVIWDNDERTLFVARDPFGIKPLYYAQRPDGFFAASQVKALVATGLVDHSLDRAAMISFLRTGAVAEPRTWCQGVFAFPPGYWATADAAGFKNGGPTHDPAAVFEGEHSAAGIGHAAVPDLVHRSVRKSIAAHAVSDVPIGLFLSGGIDSGVIAGVLRDRLAAAVTLRFLEFEGGAEDEVQRARTMASLYGIPHHVRTVTRDEFLADLPSILASMDQPSLDGVNTWYASKAMAELGVKVALSGVGADEIFQGYHHFRSLPKRLRRAQQVRRLPGGRAMLDVGAAMMARRSGDSRWYDVPGSLSSMIDGYDMQRSAMSLGDAGRLAPGTDGENPPLPHAQPRLSGDPKLALSQLEVTRYLRNQLLRDSDWASMAHGIELRTPFVDYQLLQDLAPALPHLSSFPDKALLTKVPSVQLPTDVSLASKTGFGVPIARWIGESNSWPGKQGPWAARVLSGFAAARQ